MLLNALAILGAINVGSLIWIVFMLAFHGREGCNMDSQAKAARRKARGRHGN